MLVKCDKCGQEYEVNESRLSPQGARIKCPTCANIFLVRLENSRVVTSTPSSLSAPSSSISSDNSTVGPRPQKPQQEESSWRVLNMGLPYTFHDLSSLRDWLNGRPSLDGVKVAKGDDTWGELGDYPEVLSTEMITKFFPLGDVPSSKNKGNLGNLSSSIASVQSSADTYSSSGLPSAASLGAISPMAVSSNLSVAVESGARNSRKARQEKKKKEAEEKRLKKRYIVSAVVLIFLILVIIVIMRFNMHGSESFTFVSKETGAQAEPGAQEMKEGIEQVRKTDPLLEDVQKAKAAQDPSGTEKAEAPIVTDEELAAMADADMQNRLKEAKQMVKDKKWPEALATLLSLVNDDPTHIEALELLAKTYRGLNRPEKAAEIDAQIKKVKSMADDIVIGE